MVNSPKVLLLPVAAATLLFATACSPDPPWQIYNGTSETVKLAGCAQEQGLVRTLAPGDTFTFTGDLGERVLSDDPGFACLVMTSHGDLLCLHMPSDEVKKVVFDVTEAVPTSSFLKCVENSNPHI